MLTRRLTWFAAWQAKREQQKLEQIIRRRESQIEQRKKELLIHAHQTYAQLSKHFHIPVHFCRKATSEDATVILTRRQNEQNLAWETEIRATGFGLRRMLLLVYSDRDLLITTKWQ